MLTCSGQQRYKHNVYTLIVESQFIQVSALMVTLEGHWDDHSQVVTAKRDNQSAHLLWLTFRTYHLLEEGTIGKTLGLHGHFPS